MRAASTAALASSSPAVSPKVPRSLFYRWGASWHSLAGGAPSWLRPPGASDASPSPRSDPAGVSGASSRAPSTTLRAPSASLPRPPKRSSNPSSGPSRVRTGPTPASLQRRSSFASAAFQRPPSDRLTIAQGPSSNDAHRVVAAPLPRHPSVTASSVTTLRSIGYVGRSKKCIQLDWPAP